MPTVHNSPIYKDEPASLVDAAPVITLRAAGALIFGKTTTTEFASTTLGGPSANPHDPSRTPGGSSSGSGAAVGDYQVYFLFPFKINRTLILAGPHSPGDANRRLHNPPGLLQRHLRLQTNLGRYLPRRTHPI